MPTDAAFALSGRGGAALYVLVSRTGGVERGVKRWGLIRNVSYSDFHQLRLGPLWISFRHGRVIAWYKHRRLTPRRWWLP